MVQVAAGLLTGVVTQFEDQPPSCEFAPEVAVNVTTVLSGKFPVQPLPDVAGVQLIPTGLLVTVPIPCPTLKTASVGSCPPVPPVRTSSDDDPAIVATPAAGVTG
jgi:hypothetical protein